jgi:predicted small secreted protein
VEGGIMRRTIATASLGLFLLFGVAAVLGACNTIEGLGKDTQAGGRAISNSAENIKEKL